MSFVPERVRAESVALAALAAPLVLTNLGHMALALVDVAIVGRLGEVEIAAAGLGNAIFFVIAIFGMGVLLGLDPLIAQALGAGEGRTARRLLWQGLWLAFGLTVPLSMLVLGVASQLGHVGIDASLVDPTRTYLLARLPSLLPFLALFAVRSYVQARGRGRVLFVAVVLANVVNVPVAYALSFGHPALGIPRLGIAGAGLATTVATLVQLAAAAAPLSVLECPAGPEPLRALDRALLSRVLGIGRPIGVQLVIEAGSFSLVTYLVEGFGTEVLGGHQVALTLVSVTFQVAVGVGAATSVRVGQAIGRGDAEATRRAGFVGIALGGAGMVLGALTFLTVPEPLAFLITDQVGVVEAAVPLIFVAGCFQFSDGVQTIAQGALRGAGDTRWPLAINLVGHYVIGLPLGAGLAWGARMGAPGLWWGLAIGLSFVAVATTARFARLSATAIARR